MTDEVSAFVAMHFPFLALAVVEAVRMNGKKQLLKVTMSNERERHVFLSMGNNRGAGW